jgi:pimeloyl-ACP methyl ester carboxylesterase
MAFVDVNGVRLSYDVRGEGEPVVFVCGTAQKAAQWDLIMRAQVTDAGFATIAFENRGIEPSSCPEPPWTVSDMASDTIGLIEALGLGPVHLVGGSLGAIVTQTVALRRPDLVRSAVLYIGGGNASVQGRLQILGSYELARRGVELPDDLTKLFVLNALLTPAQMANDATMRATLPVLAAMGAGGAGPWGPGGQLGQLSANASWCEADHLDELAGMKPPCLFIAAEFDYVFPPPNVQAAVAKAPNAEYVEIPGSAHVTLDPASAALIPKAAVEFLAKHRGRASSR